MSPPTITSCNRTFSAGFIVFRVVDQNQIEYLMLKASDLKNQWAPPKGHINQGETKKEAAIRKVCEDTGLAPDQYAVIEEIHFYADRVPYWVARLLDPNSRIKLSQEYAEFRWIELKMLEGVCTPDTKIACSQVDVQLRLLLF